MLDISSLKNAVTKLQGNYALAQNREHQYFEQFRGATIQSFEYTYELAFRFIKRGLDRLSPGDETLDQMVFRDVLRKALEAGLITDMQIWVEAREKRNITAHSYDEAKADKVLAGLDIFTMEVKHLLHQLERAR